MKLQFLGIGSAYNPSLGNTAAYFRRGRTMFLLDCGETVYSALRARDVLVDIDCAVILITHFHADHCGSLPTLISYLQGVAGAKVTIVQPMGERMRAFLDIAGADGYELVSGCGGSVLEGVRIVPHPVEHSQGMPSFGYVLDDGEDCLYYSGDAARVPDEVLKEFLGGRIRRMYIDCCVKPSRDHGELARHCAAIPLEARGRVACMHLSPDAMDAIREKGFKIAGEEC